MTMLYYHLFSVYPVYYGIVYIPPIYLKKEAGDVRFADLYMKVTIYRLIIYALFVSTELPILRGFHES